MKIVIEAPGPIEVEEVKLENGKLSMKPLFYDRGAEAAGPILRVYNEDGSALYTGIVRVSGRDGSLSLKERTSPVLPALDLPKGTA